MQGSERCLLFLQHQTGKLQLMVYQKKLKKKRCCSYAIDSLEVRSGSKDAQRAEKGHSCQSWFSGKALRSKGYPH